MLFHDAIATHLGINTTEHKVLDLIGRRPGASPTQLTEETGLSNPAITKITNRLVELGYVRRERDRSDGRKIALFVTPAHRESMTGVMEPLLEGMARVTNELTEAELKTVGRWLTGTITALREATATVTQKRTRSAQTNGQNTRRGR